MASAAEIGRRGPSRATEDRLLLSAFRRNARTFALAARLLPRRKRVPVATLYRYCRTIDEIADGRPGRVNAAGDLAAARRALADTLAGRPPEDAADAMLWRRLGEVNRDFGLDADPLEELIDGAAWDIDGRPIRDTADLLAYSDLVAGSVGAMMLPLLVDGAEDRIGLVGPARALGRAMQLTNILRDVGEDRDRLGRVYFPADALRRHGIDLDATRPPVPAGYRALCEEVMRLAEDLYDSAEPGVDGLPAATRAAVRAAARMYREILNEVRRAGYDNLTRRAVVPPHRKLMAAGGGYARRRRRLVEVPA